MKDFRIGQGFDAHCFCYDRPLVLGGVIIPHEKGLLGHSDADVLTHAIMDALLGAAHLGDIGVHFPPSDKKWKNISSLDLLKKVSDFLSVNGWKVENIDATVITQAPRLRPFIESMEKNICNCIKGMPGVSVKATTTEGMGFTGRNEGMAAIASALITREKGNNDAEQN